MYSPLVVYKRTFVREIQNMIEHIEEDSGGQLLIVSYEDKDTCLSLDFKVSPLQGPYAHAVYRFEMLFENNRPTSLPKIHSPTYIHHPNIVWIDGQVQICLNLFDEWQISMGIRCLLDGLLFLFCEPNFDDILNDEFIVPIESSGEEVVKIALEGGKIFGVQHTANDEWLAWKRYSQWDEATTDMLNPPTAAQPVPQSSSYRQYMSSDTAQTRIVYDNSVTFDTIDLNEIMILWQCSSSRSSQSIPVSFYSAENVYSNTELEVWKDAHYGQLNPRPVAMASWETCQQCFHRQRWERAPAMSNGQTSDRVDSLTGEAFNLAVKRRSDELTAVYARETARINRLAELSWFFQLTRWPVYVCPGLPLTRHLMELKWPNFPSVSSTRELFREVNAYFSKTPLTLYSTVFLIDSLALSPCSPIIIRLLVEPENDEALTDSTNRITVCEWLSPWYTSRYHVRQQSERHNIPFRRFLPWLTLASNWLTFISRLELHHCSLGYSRPSVFSPTRRCTDPAGLAHLQSMGLVCGRAGWLDGWPLWLAAWLSRGLVHGTVAMAQTLQRRYYTRLNRCDLLDHRYSKSASMSAVFLFSAVDYL